MRLASIALLAVVLCPSLVAFATPTPAQAQTGDPAGAAQGIGSTYKLTFVVRELAAGKVLGSRTYGLLFVDNRQVTPASIRAGNRVPIYSSASTYEYRDIGVNIDVRPPNLPPAVALGPHLLGLFVGAQVSSVASTERNPPTPPLLREEEWKSNFVVEIGKPTLLFSSDDPLADRTTQVELTAVKVQ